MQVPGAPTRPRRDQSARRGPELPVGLPRMDPAENLPQAGRIHRLPLFPLGTVLYPGLLLPLPPATVPPDELPTTLFCPPAMTFS